MWAAVANCEEEDGAWLDSRQQCFSAVTSRIGALCAPSALASLPGAVPTKQTLLHCNQPNACSCCFQFSENLFVGFSTIVVVKNELKLRVRVKSARNYALLQLLQLRLMTGAPLGTAPNNGDRYSHNQSATFLSFTDGERQQQDSSLCPLASKQKN